MHKKKIKSRKCTGFAKVGMAIRGVCYLNNNVEVYLFTDRRGVHPGRLVLTLFQRKLVFGRLSVDWVVKVHAGNVAMQVMPVQHESSLKNQKEFVKLHE